MINLCWVQQCQHGEGEQRMMDEGWKMYCLERQVSEDHRRTVTQQDMGGSEGLENERTESRHIRTFWSMSFSFQKQQHVTVSIGDCP